MKISFIRTQSRISGHINGVNRKLSMVPDEAHKFFQKSTPVATGNARKNTTLSKDTIYAKYPYALRLDRGYSRQAPVGMSKPTIKYVQGLVKRILGK